MCKYSSGGRALTCKGLDPTSWQMDPAWQMQLQFGLFSIPVSGPQMVQPRLWNVMSYVWDNAYKRSIAAYQKEQPMWQQWVSSIEMSK